MEMVFSSEQDWSPILYPYMKTLFEETELSYFGHVVHDGKNFNWMMSNDKWAQIYWRDGLYLDEPIYNDIQKLTLKNNQCIALWDCYHTSNDEYQREVMRRRMDVCRVKNGITIGKLIGNKAHYISFGWKEHRSSDMSLSSSLVLKKYINPIWILHNQLVQEQKSSGIHLEKK